MKMDGPAWRTYATLVLKVCCICFLGVLCPEEAGFKREKRQHHLDAGIQTPALNGQREGTGPRRDLLLKLVDAGHLAAGDLDLEVLEPVGLLGQSALDVLADLDGLVNVASDTLKVLLAKATASHGGGADAETARGQG